MDDASGGWNAVAQEFIARRSPVIGVSVVRNWAAAIPSGGAILDLGCGHGFLISSALSERGFSVYGVDASADLVLECRRRLPKAQVMCEAVEVSSFFCPESWRSNPFHCPDTGSVVDRCADRAAIAVLGNRGLRSSA